MKTPRTNCCVDHCENKSEHPRSGLCKTCYAAMYYWTRAKNNKSPTDILNYRRKLTVRQARMAILQPAIVQLKVRVKEREKVRVR